MTTAVVPSSVAVLDGAFDYTCAALEAARSSSLALPTPCAGWDLGDLLQHMGDSVAAIGEAAETGYVGVAVQHRSPEMLVDRVRRRAFAAREAWLARPTSAPVQVDDLWLDRDTLVLVAAVEVAVHGWDVARAVGLTTPLPDNLAGPLEEVAHSVVTSGERARRFAPPLFVPPSARPGTRLLAHLGRG